MISLPLKMHRKGKLKNYRNGAETIQMRIFRYAIVAGMEKNGMVSQGNIIIILIHQGITGLTVTMEVTANAINQEREEVMNEELIGKLAQLAQDYAALHSQDGLVGVYDNSVQVTNEFYRATWPEYRTHTMENAGRFIRISHTEGAVEFFSLFELKVKDIADLL